MRAVGLAFVVLVASATCAGEDGGVEEENSTRILALGDSYTIGEAVEERSRWPEQLADRLEEAGSGPVAVEIVARTGWTTAELDAGIDAAAPMGPFDLVTLQIGVNDQYRGLPVDGYRAEFAGVLDRAIGFAGGDARRMIVVSIPDWGVTPFAESRDRSFVSSAIDAFNDANREVALAAGAAWVDVTGISRSGDPGLVGGDGLHPSAGQYTRWVEAVLPVARRILSGG